MNRKQFGILLILLIVLGGAGWYLQKNQNRDAGAGEQGTGQKLLGEAFPVNDVTQITLRHGPDELNLVKKGDLWRVQESSDYPASFSAISSFLLNLRDLRVIQNEEVGPSKLPHLQLEPWSRWTNSGVHIDLKDKDGKALRTLTLGLKLMSRAPAQQQAAFGRGAAADGRYVMLGTNSGHVLVISDPLNNVVASPSDWLDKDFFKIERPKAIAVAFPVATNSWKIVRDTESGDWKLTDQKSGEKLDAARVSGVSSPFSSPSFNDVQPLATNSETKGVTNTATVTVDTFDDLTYEVKVGPKAEPNYPITLTVTPHFPTERIPAKDEKPQDKELADKAWKARQKELDEKLKDTKRFENWTYLVPTWSVDPVLKERKDLLEEKKEEPKPADKPQAAAAKPEQPPADPLAPPDKLN